MGLSLVISLLKRLTYLSFVFWLCWLFLAALGLSLVVVSGGILSSSGVRASHCGGVSCCGACALGNGASGAVAHGLRCSWVGGIFPDKGSTRVPCMGRWILSQKTTREALSIGISNKFPREADVAGPGTTL